MAEEEAAAVALAPAAEEVAAVAVVAAAVAVAVAASVPALVSNPMRRKLMRHQLRQWPHFFPHARLD